MDPHRYGRYVSRRRARRRAWLQILLIALAIVIYGVYNNRQEQQPPSPSLSSAAGMVGAEL